MQVQLFFLHVSFSAHVQNMLVTLQRMTRELEGNQDSITLLKQDVANVCQRTGLTILPFLQDLQCKNPVEDYKKQTI